MKNHKVVAIIQARMGSTRLPGKILMDLMGKPVLEHVVERVQAAEGIDQVVVATTREAVDDAVESFCRARNIPCFRGSSEDVLNRYYQTAQRYEAEVIIRITSDCPLIDPKVLGEMLSIFQSGNFDLVTNAGADLSNRTFPRGLDAEIFSYAVLENADRKAAAPYQREHVTPFIYETAESIRYFLNDEDYSEYRLTLDTEADYALLLEIYSCLYKGQHDFYLREIVALLKTRPELLQINRHVEQKKLID